MSFVDVYEIFAFLLKWPLRFWYVFPKSKSVYLRKRNFTKRLPVFGIEKKCMLDLWRSPSFLFRSEKNQATKLCTVTNLNVSIINLFKLKINNPKFFTEIWTKNCDRGLKLAFLQFMADNLGSKTVKLWVIAMENITWIGRNQLRFLKMKYYSSVVGKHLRFSTKDYTIDLENWLNVRKSKIHCIFHDALCSLQLIIMGWVISSMMKNYV